MTTFLLYVLTAAGVIWLASRFVARIPLRSALLLAAFPLVFVGPALLTGRVYAPIDLPYQSPPLRAEAPARGVVIHNPMLSDVYCLNIPWKYATRVAYRHGELALWNPSMFCGDILAAAAQSTPYEPMLLLSLLLPMANSLTFLAAMVFLLAGLCMYLLMRELGCGEAGALTGAAAWMFCTFLVFWLEWVIAASALWLPLIVTGVRRIVRTGAVSGAAILTAAFVLSILNGHPESLLHMVGIGMGWAAWELAQVRGRGIVRAAALGIGSGVVALALTAVYLLPIVEAIPQSVEHGMRKQFFATGPRSAPASQIAARLRYHILPFEYGDPSARQFPKGGAPFSVMESGYAGSVALALAVFALWRSGRREKWALLGVALAGLVFGSEIPPFGDLLAKLPLFDIALNNRLIFAFAFALAALAALGVEVLAEPAERRRFGALAGGVAVALALLTAARWGAMRSAGLSAGFLRERAAYLLVPPVVAALLVAFARRRAVWSAAPLILILVQRTLEISGFYPTLPAGIFYPRVPILERLPKTAEPYRITGVAYTFVPNTATMYSLEDIRGYEAMTFARLVDTWGFWCEPQPVWFNRVDDVTRPFLRALNLRFALRDAGNQVPPGWRRIATGSAMDLWENEHPLPRAWVPERVRFESDRVKIVTEMKDEADFGTRGWIEAAGRSDEQSNGPGIVRTERRGSGELAMTASMSRDGWVFVSETAWKGWRAYVDGRRLRWVFADHALIGIPVLAGTHSIRLVYLPQSFVTGRIISIATALALVVGAVVVGRRRGMVRGVSG